MNTQYLKREDGMIRFSGPLAKLKNLPAGVYSVNIDRFGEYYLNTFETYTDELIALAESPAEKISNDVDNFLSDEVRMRFEKYNLLCKRGLLMYGEPGTGKTSIVHLLIQKAIAKDMVVFMNPQPYLVQGAINQIRAIEDNNRPVMVIWEEFERWVEDEEGDILDLLDGVDQVDNAFFLATTNYINQIPSRIRNRPSRFAEVLEVGPPNATLRRAYLEAKIHEDDNVNLDEWVERTEGLTIDHLKDIIISVLVIGLSLDAAIEKVRIMQREDEEGYEDEGTTEETLGKLRAKIAMADSAPMKAR